jgi:hypothetical protein
MLRVANIVQFNGRFGLLIGNILQAEILFEFDNNVLA